MIPGGPLDPDQKRRIAECLELLQLICHLSPAAALEKLKWVVEKIDAEADVDFESRYYFHAPCISDALVRLAYADEEFGQACDLLLKFVLVGSKPHIDNARHSLVSLFLPQLSGSIAKTATRVAWVRKALDSSDDREIDIGVDCVRAALIGRGWTAVSVSVVDTRPSPYGRRLSRSEALDWVQDWSRLSVDVAIKATKLSWRLRHFLAEFAAQAAKHFPEALDHLLQAIIPLNQQERWVEGWNVLQDVLRSSRVVEDERIKALLDECKPLTLVDHIRAALRSKGYLSLDRSGTEEATQAAIEAHDAQLVRLAESLAEDSEQIQLLDQDLVAPVHNNPIVFGKSLGRCPRNQERVWSILRNVFFSCSTEQPKHSILRGYLSGLDESNPCLAGAARDECLNHPKLGRLYARLASWPCRSPAEFERLCLSARIAESKELDFEFYLHCPDSGLSFEQRLRLMRALQSSPVGARVVLSALANLLNREKTKGADPTLTDFVVSVVEAALEAAAEDVWRRDQSLDYELSEVIQHGLFEINTEGVTRLMSALKRAALRRLGFFRWMNDTFQALVKLAPKELLDVFFECDQGQFGVIHWDPEYFPLAGVDLSTLLGWCGNDPARSALVARSIKVFSARHVGSGWELSPVARALLERAPTRGEVLEAFLSRVASFGFGVSHDLVVAQLDALNVLTQHPDLNIRARVREFISTTRQKIEADRRKELEREREQTLRFE